MATAIQDKAQQSKNPFDLTHRGRQNAKWIRNYNIKTHTLKLSSMQTVLSTAKFISISTGNSKLNASSVILICFSGWLVFFCQVP